MELDTEGDYGKKGSWNWKGNSVKVYSKEKGKEVDVEVHVSFPSIYGLEASGASKVYSTGGLELEKLLMEVTGAAKTHLNVTADYVEIEQSGAAHTDIKLATEKLVTELDGAAKLSIMSLTDIAYLETEQSGAAHLTINGKVDKLIAEMSGAAKLTAKDLQVGYADLETSGAANVNLGTVHEVIIEASGGSNVHYHRSADTKVISEDVSGGARVVSH